MKVALASLGGARHAGSVISGETHKLSPGRDGATHTGPQLRARPGTLLDRDGTIIVDHGYVGSIDRVEFIEGAPEAIAGFNRADILVAVLKIKTDLLGFLLTAASEGRSVAGYGAPGKGNTLLNHCGIRSDLLSYTVDRSPFKQGKFLPGTHIPIYAPERLAETKPDYILVLPWNLRDEISRQLGYVGSWGGKLVFPIPELEIVSVGCES